MNSKNGKSEWDYGVGSYKKRTWGQRMIAPLFLISLVIIMFILAYLRGEIWHDDGTVHPTKQSTSPNERFGPATESN